jgi:putative AlgH/UPF0301 family transcriptional regulator
MNPKEIKIPAEQILRIVIPASVTNLMQNVSVVLVIAYNAFGYMGIIVSQAIADVLTAMIAMILFKRQLYREFH